MIKLIPVNIKEKCREWSITDCRFGLERPAEIIGRLVNYDIFRRAWDESGKLHYIWAIPRAMNISSRQNDLI